MLGRIYQFIIRVCRSVDPEKPTSCLRHPGTVWKSSVAEWLVSVRANYTQSIAGGRAGIRRMRPPVATRQYSTSDFLNSLGLLELVGLWLAIVFVQQI
jgi:hypothetical protein